MTCRTCTNDCRQGRDCPHRFVERNDTITITLLSAVFTLAVLGGVVWGMLT